MPGTNAINTAVYKLLKNDAALAGMCTIYKGAKRPVTAQNPQITVQAKRLEPGEGEGMWICDVVVTTYVDLNANRTTSEDLLGTLLARVNEVLADAELDLESGKAFPLIEGRCTCPEWHGVHDSEAMQERTYGLVLVDFGNVV